MPKEIIYPSAPTTDAPYRPVVGWSDGGSVQVGIDADRETLLRVLYGDGDRYARIGAAIRDLAENNPGGSNSALGREVLDAIETVTGDAARGVHTHLDRGACNRLIRAIRKARDAAYGRDE